MFGIFDDAMDLVEGAINTTTKAVSNAATHVEKRVSDFIDDPIGETVKQAVRPIVDAIDVIDGLTEGELRTKAALSLGAEVVSGMAVGELIEWYEASQ